MNTNAIIIVEDDCNFLKDAFKENGFQRQILCFNNPVDALIYLRATNKTTSIIISDINMPFMNGISFKRAINADEYLNSQKIPFVFLSSVVDDLDSALQLSVAACIKKPQNINDYDLIAKKINEISLNSFHA